MSKEACFGLVWGSSNAENRSVSSERYEQLHDLLAGYESSILKLESDLQECQGALPGMETTAAEMTPLLPDRAGFARERSIRLMHRTARLHKLFGEFRKEFQILHRHMDKIRRDARLTLIPLPEERKEVRKADYTLFRLGDMSFCVMDRPVRVEQDVSVSNKIADATLDLFPGRDTISIFAPGKSRLGLLYFGEGKTEQAIWFEEMLEPVIESSHMVQLQPAGVAHPRVRGKFRFRGVDYYVVTLSDTE